MSRISQRDREDRSSSASGVLDSNSSSTEILAVQRQYIPLTSAGLRVAAAPLPLRHRPVPMQSVIYLVISDAVERAAMERMLRDAHLQYRSYSSAQALLDAGPPSEPGCVVADLGADMQGLALRRKLSARQYQMPSLFLAHDNRQAALFDAAKGGDVAILERPVRHDDLIDSITELLETQRRRLEEEEELQAIESRIARLTHRESEVTMRVLQGLSNKEISNELGISVRTVEKHRAAVMTKLGASNLAQLCRMRRHCEKVFATFAKAGGKPK
jgi:two-component system, LuxR family, response regulator FixJ